MNIDWTILLLVGILFVLIRILLYLGDLRDFWVKPSNSAETRDAFTAELTEMLVDIRNEVRKIREELVSPVNPVNEIERLLRDTNDSLGEIVSALDDIRPNTASQD